MPGSVFALGWRMAQLFDELRLETYSAFDSSFDAAPAPASSSAARLDPAQQRQLVVADLTGLLAPYAPGLTAEEVAAASRAQPYDPAKLKAAAGELHLRVLDRFAGDDERISAYQLGLALSDTCWLPSAAGGPDSLLRMFGRGQVAALKTWLGLAGSQLPDSAAATVSRSLENWQDWIDVNAPGLKAATPVNTWAQSPEPIVRALRIQAFVWHSVLVNGPQTGEPLSVEAWVQAGASTLRAGRLLALSVLRRFWWVAALFAVILGALLYLAISSLTGAGQVWTTLATVAATLGIGTTGLQAAVTRAGRAVGSDILKAARMDAMAWNVTWLPALPQGVMRRYHLDVRGVAAPRIRKSLD